MRFKPGPVHNKRLQQRAMLRFLQGGFMFAKKSFWTILGQFWFITHSLIFVEPLSTVQQNVSATPDSQVPTANSSSTNVIRIRVQITVSVKIQ